jgi:hypothetical protein
MSVLDQSTKNVTHANFEDPTGREKKSHLSKVLVPGDSSINGTSFARVMTVISSSSSILGFALIALLILSNAFGLWFVNAFRGNTRRR